MFGNNFSIIEKKQYLESKIGFALLVEGYYIPEEKVTSWRAKIPYVESLCDGLLISIYGLADDPEKAINDYWRMVFSAKKIVVDAYKSCRLEFEVDDTFGLREVGGPF